MKKKLKIVYVLSDSNNRVVAVEGVAVLAPRGPREALPHQLERGRGPAGEHDRVIL